MLLFSTAVLREGLNEGKRVPEFYANTVAGLRPSAIALRQATAPG